MTQSAASSKYTKEKVLLEFISKASRTIADTGIDAKTASELAVSLARQISIDWGGQLIYITKRQARMARDLQIYAEFTGTNFDELKARYDLSERQLRRIINTIKKHLLSHTTAP